ncbi:hypothetical protein DE146DRAFT_760925 [Phaeosphaeria sp. MPI-PUGE-AT-0046c]|nr:hypothetical protein DE146DRAFT_760925 [Phaeosphaeria sp. MPI-PUGE-AT-0046c]
MASSQLSSPLSRLPRELRDQIYHFLFHETPYLIQRFSPYDPSNASSPEERILPPYPLLYASNLLYLRYRHRSNAQGPNGPCYPTDSTYPEWIRTCKMFMIEGIDVFQRNAEWYFPGCRPHADLQAHWTNKLFRLDTTNVTAMQLYVNNLANFEEPFRHHGTNSRADLEYFARLVRKTGMRIKHLRFVGHSYNLRPGAETCKGQAQNMMRNLVNIFHSLGVQDCSFGIVQPHVVGLWVLYAWIIPPGRDDANGYLELVVRQLSVGSIRLS